MPESIKPQSLEYPIQPTLIVDDYAADVVYISLSPEVPLQQVMLSECFERVAFKGSCKADWAKALREIADGLEKE